MRRNLHRLGRGGKKGKNNKVHVRAAMRECLDDDDAP